MEMSIETQPREGGLVSWVVFGTTYSCGFADVRQMILALFSRLAGDPDDGLAGFSGGIGRGCHDLVDPRFERDTFLRA